MEKVQPLLDAFLLPEYKTRYRSAKSTHTCLMCGTPAWEFRDEWAELEYDVSALCQECQDRYFGGD